MVRHDRRAPTTGASLALVLAFAACTGSIEPAAPGGTPGVGTGGSPSMMGGGGPASAGGTGTGGIGAAQGAGGAAAPRSFSPAGTRLRRLTSLEYRNSVVDLLGAGTQITVELEKDTTYNNLTSVAASTIALSAKLTEQLETSALALATALVKDSARRQKVVGCTPTGTTDETCLRSFVTSFGRRAFRRPLTAEEITDYVALGKNAMTTLSDFWGGVQYVVAAVLQSPGFFYRSEVGVSDAAAPAGARALDGYQLAARLSYFLWSTTPDDALLSAADAGSLARIDDLRREVDRLLASPRVDDALVDVFSQVLRLPELDTLPQSPTLFPSAGSATLGASMRGETQAVVRDLFARNGDYRELFTTTKTFLNAELATLYGVRAPTGTGFVATTLPADGARGGLLGQASFLALNAHADGTSPTLRGKFIVETLLCNAILPPPNDIVTDIPEKDRNKTKREQLAIHQTLPVCAGCHAMMDPLGLALEQFDAIGAYRETDRGMALDVSGSIDGKAFGGPRELGRLLADGLKTVENQPESADCLVRTLLRVATGHLERAGDQPVVTNLTAAFAADTFRVRNVLAKVATSDAFRFVGLPE